MLYLLSFTNTIQMFQFDSSGMPSLDSGSHPKSGTFHSLHGPGSVSSQHGKTKADKVFVYAV